MTQREFPASPLVAVGAVVVDAQGRVLLARRAREPLAGHWSLPGGLLELGESLLDGIRREVAEETGLNVQPETVVEVVDRIYREGARVRYHYVIVDYWCRVISGHPQPASDVTELLWATREMWNAADRENSIQSFMLDLKLDSVTVQVIEKGWQLAQSAGVHG